MIIALTALGVRFDYDATKDTIIVFGTNGKFIYPENGTLNCKLAGTTSRFLVSLSVLFDFDITIIGEGKLLERPIDDLINIINDLGIETKYLGKTGSLPVFISGNKKIQSAEIDIDGSKSSQFLTGMLMMASFCNIKKINVINNLVSKSYIDVT